MDKRVASIAERPVPVVPDRSPLRKPPARNAPIRQKVSGLA